MVPVWVLFVLVVVNGASIFILAVRLRNALEANKFKVESGDVFCLKGEAPGWRTYEATANESQVTLEKWDCVTVKDILPNGFYVVHLWLRLDEGGSAISMNETVIIKLAKENMQPVGIASFWVQKYHRSI